jgi:hypothetical protein
MQQFVQATVLMVAHGIANLHIVEFIGMWLEAGILKGNELHETERGAAQGTAFRSLQEGGCATSRRGWASLP